MNSKFRQKITLLVFAFTLNSSVHALNSPTYKIVQINAHPKNCSVRDISTPTILHILYTGESEEDSIKAFKDPTEAVSVHYLISEDGKTVFEVVPETKAAHHAGKGNWGFVNSVNQYSIGIALVNKGVTEAELKEKGWRANFPKYPDAQINTLIALSKVLVKKWNIKPWNIVGHSDIAPQRKFDPGLQFPWEHLAKNGIGVWVAVSSKSLPKKVDKQKFLKELTKYGYRVPSQKSSETDKDYYASTPVKNVVAAFQAHFRPTKVTGQIDPESNAILNLLIQLQH